MPHVISAVNIYSKIMKITHIQVRSSVSKPYFPTKSQSTSTALRQQETSACMPYRYHSLSCSCSQVLTALITSSSGLNFRQRTALLGFRTGGYLKVLGRGCRVDGVTLSSCTRPSFCCLDAPYYWSFSGCMPAAIVPCCL
jgi:hypothetical protein